MMSRYLTYQCPQTNATVQLNLSADSLDEVQFRTMTIQDCGACHEEHALEKSDLSLGDEELPEQP
jgi:hypothetical protein